MTSEEYAELKAEIRVLRESLVELIGYVQGLIPPDAPIRDRE